MVSEETRQIIDSMTKEELLEEINKGRRSRFQRENYAYAQTRHAILEQQEKEEQRQQGVSQKQEELSLAREANQLSHKANKISKIAIGVSILAALIALGALIFNIYSSGKSSTPTHKTATLDKMCYFV
jgi:hypothetical protein